MSECEKLQALTDLVLAIFRINGSLLENSDKRVSPYGITGAQWQALGPIGISDSPMTAPQIAKFIGITRQGVQKQLNNLRDRGLVECCSNPHHERSPLYELTEIGKEKFQRVCQLHEKSRNEFAERFDQDEVRTTLKVLAKFHEYLIEEEALLSGKE